MQEGNPYYLIGKSLLCKYKVIQPPGFCITGYPVLQLGKSLLVCREFPFGSFEKSLYLCIVVRIVGNAEVQPMNVNHSLKGIL